MAGKLTESASKCGPSGKKRKLKNAPSSQDCKKRKDECVEDDTGTNNFKSEEIKNPEKVSITCANCVFSADTKDAFPLHVFVKGSNRYYCAKKKCQKAGMPSKFTGNKRKCGLCGKTKKLMKTECCDNWICDDEHKYVLFSFRHNSCCRNHHRYSQCSHHYNEKHQGRWQDCKECGKWPFDYDFTFEEALKNSDYVLCINCGFSSRAAKTDIADCTNNFPLQVTLNGSKSYFCSRRKCQRAGLPAKPIKRIPKPKCGLCGKTGKLTKTECCNRLICDDEHKYRLFSFALNSCRRNHRRYSSCAYHFHEKHEGRLQDCKKCQDGHFNFDYNSDEELRYQKDISVLSVNSHGGGDSQELPSSGKDRNRPTVISLQIQ